MANMKHNINLLLIFIDFKVSRRPLNLFSNGTESAINAFTILHDQGGAVAEKQLVTNTYTSVCASTLTGNMIN